MFKTRCKNHKLVTFLAAGTLVGVLSTTNTQIAKADDTKEVKIDLSALAKAKQELADTQNKKQAASEKLALLEKQESDLKVLIEEASLGQADLKKEYQELLTKKEKASQELKAMKNNLALKQQELSKKKQELQDFENKIAQLPVEPAKNREIAQINKRIETLGNQLRVFTNNGINEKQKVIELTKKAQNLEEKINNSLVENEKEQLRSDLSDVNAQIEEAKKIYESRQEKIEWYKKQIEEKKAALEKLQVNDSQKAQDLKKQVEQIKQEIKEIEDDIAVAQTGVSQKEKVLTEINAHLATINPDDNGKLVALTNQHEKINEDLANLKLEIENLTAAISVKTVEIEKLEQEASKPIQPIEPVKPNTPDHHADVVIENPKSENTNEKEKQKLPLVEAETKPIKKGVKITKIKLKVRHGRFFIKKDGQWKTISKRKLAKLLPGKEVKAKGIARIMKKKRKFNLYDKNGKKMKQRVKAGQTYKTWAFKTINHQLMVRLGNQQQWLPIKYLKFSK